MKEDFIEVLGKLSEENDKKNKVLDDMAEAMKLLGEQITNCFEYAKACNKLVEHEAKTNKAQDTEMQMLLNLVDNLQEQIDALAKK